MGESKGSYRRYVGFTSSMREDMLSLVDIARKLIDWKVTRKLEIWVSIISCLIFLYLAKHVLELTAEDVAKLDAAGSKNSKCVLVQIQTSTLARLLGILFFAMIFYSASHCYRTATPSIAGGRNIFQ
jgi:hypothetical protein